MKKKIYKMIKKVVIFHYRKRKPNKIRNSNFTILTNTCVGGFIYHYLGMQFLSPTINIWMGEEDFLKFSLNLTYYVKSELQLVKYADGVDCKYPICSLSDLVIHFKHCDSFDKARDEWNRRKERINYKNLYFICMLDNDHVINREVEERIKQNFNNYCFFTKNLKKQRYFKMKKREWYQSDIFGIKQFEKKFNYIKFLNKTRQVL